MDGENVFGQLRRIARNVQNESALAEERMKRPVALRSSGDSARPVLRRMQADAHNVKREAGNIQSHLPSSSEFNKLLDSCSQLCDAYRSKVNLLEGYLQQYGYQPQPSKVKGLPVLHSIEKEAVGTGSQHPEGDLSATSANDAEEMKENVPTTPSNKPNLGSSWKGGTPRLEDFGLSRGFLDQVSRSKHQDNKDPQEVAEKLPQPKPVEKLKHATPAKNPHIALPEVGGTPKLEDFGLSSNFLENISKKNLHNQQRHAAMQGSTQLSSTYNSKQMERARSPVGAPTQANACPFTPIGVTTTPSARVTVTPGIFGGNEFPEETPTKFIDMACDLPRGHAGQDNESSGYQGAKKSLQYKTSNKNGAASVLDSIPSNLTENDDQFGTPQPPELTARWDFTSNQAPIPSQPEFTMASDKPPNKPDMFANLGHQTDTPPTPEMTAKWNIRTTSKAFGDLAPSEPSFIMEEPVRLTSHEPKQTPEEPQRLYTEKPQPSLDDMPETPPGLSGKLGDSKSFDLSRFMADEMPKTPELTMSYTRYVDPRTQPAKVSKSVVDTIPERPSGHNHAVKVEEPIHSQYPEPEDIAFVAMVMDDEFSKQSSHMKRILPLTLVNETISCINTILNIKHKRGDGVYLTDEDVQMLSLGPKSKAMLLFLITIKRLLSEKPPGTSEVVYYPVF
nr:proteoglycan 4-like [Lytechinus pictus]